MAKRIYEKEVASVRQQTVDHLLLTNDGLGHPLFQLEDLVSGAYNGRLFGAFTVDARCRVR